MKILLTGGAGFIGSHTYVELLKAGHEAVIVDNFYNASEHVLDRLKTITGQHVCCYNVDVTDAAELDKGFASHLTRSSTLRGTRLSAKVWGSLSNTTATTWTAPSPCVR